MGKESSEKKKDVFLITIKDEKGEHKIEYPMTDVKPLAQQLGFDLDSDLAYYWFLKQALLTLLPKGWKRESDPRGVVMYHNQQTCATTEIHPLQYHYRTAKNEGVENKTPNPEELEQGPTPFEQLQFTSLMNIQAKRGPQLEAALQAADAFYSSMIDYSSPAVPQFIAESADYQQLSPIDMRETAKKLGIRNNHKLFWVARLCLALPLPPCWEVTTDPLGEKRYLTYEYNLVIDDSPAIPFMQKLVTRMLFDNRIDSPDLMFFYDKEMMPYVVDLKALSNDEKKFKVDEDGRKTCDIVTKALYREHVALVDVIQDMMLLELCRIAAIDWDREIHLVLNVEKFIKSLRKQKVFKQWHFRYTLEGERYWYLLSEERAYRHFPYTQTLVHVVENKRSRLVKKSKPHILSIADRHPLFATYGEDLFHDVTGHAYSAMAVFVQALLEEDLTKAKKNPIDISELVKDYNLDIKEEEEGLNLLFTNPYRLTDQITFLEREDKEPKLSIDSEIDREGNVLLSGVSFSYTENATPEFNHSSVFRNKNLMLPKASPHRSIPRSKTFKKPHPDTDSVDRRQSLKASDDSESIAESFGSDESNSDAHQRGSIRESFSENEEDSFRTKIESPILQKQVTFQEDEQKVDPDPEDQKEKAEIPEIKTVIAAPPKREILSFHSIPPLSDLPCSRGSSHECLSNKSSRASKRILHSVLSSRPNTGLVKIQEKTPKRRRLTEKNGKKREEIKKNAEKTLGFTPKKESKFESKAEAPINKTPLRVFGTHQETTIRPNLIPLQETLSEVDSSMSPQLIRSRRGSMSEQKVFSPSNMQSPIPVLSPIPDAEQMYEKASSLTYDQALVSDTETRAQFGKFSNAVAGSFFDLEHNSESPEELMETAKPEAMTEWLEKEEVEKGLEKLMLPEIKEAQNQSILETGSPVTQSTNPPHRNVLQVPTRRELESALQLPRLSIMSIGTSSRRDSYVMAETAGVRAIPIPLAKLKLQRKKLALKPLYESVDGLPSNFVLSPKARTGAPQFTSFPKTAPSSKEIRIRNFLYYLEKVGFPLNQKAALVSYRAKSEVLPIHVIRMGKRLGLKVTSQKYSSAESDLLWIPLLQLSVPVPMSFKQANLPSQMVMLPFKSHPGDEFFMLMTDYNRKVRVRELGEMTDKEEQLKSVIKESWLCLTTIRNQPFLYNFLTGKRERLSMAPIPVVPDLSSDRRIKELKAYFESQLKPGSGSST